MSGPTEVNAIYNLPEDQPLPCHRPGPEAREALATQAGSRTLASPAVPRTQIGGAHSGMWKPIALPPR